MDLESGGAIIMRHTLMLQLLWTIAMPMTATEGL